MADAAQRAITALTIAQIKFKQALKKADRETRLPETSSDAYAQFLHDLDAVLKQNTRVNVEKCTHWIVKHIASSDQKVAALGDYLSEVSKKVISADPQSAADAKKAMRNRFDLLSLVNDVLHAQKFHSRSAGQHSNAFSKACGKFVPGLIEHTASRINKKNSRDEKKLRTIINYWAVNHMFDTENLQLLRDTADDALLMAQGGTPTRRRTYLLPEYHGDKSAPWYDLPASYMLEHMIRDPEHPIDSSRIKITKFDNKPVSPHVRNLLDNFFENIDLKYVPTGDNRTGETSKHKLCLDSLGQTVKEDKETGTTSIIYNAYGWSKKLCQDMRKYGVPENIKVQREDEKRMNNVPQPHIVQQTHRHERRSKSPPRRQHSWSSESSHRRGREERRESYSSYDSRHSYSRSRSRQRSHGPRNVSSQTRRDRSGDWNRADYDQEPRQHRAPPGPHSVGSSNTQNFAQRLPTNQQGSQLPSDVPTFHHQQDLSQPPGRYAGQFPPVPPPGHFRDGFVPPPPPPIFSGPRASSQNIMAMPNMPFNPIDQAGQQYGDNHGHGQRNAYTHNQSGYPYGNDHGYGQRDYYAHNQGGNNQGGYHANQSSRGGSQYGRGGPRNGRGGRPRGRGAYRG